MLDRTLSHYRIESRLGEGGMGVVYLARDLALGRSAALKVVANHVDADLKDRFLREADASARLQHPAIATFYESSQADGQAFIAMEYVRGRTLRELLNGGALPPRTAIAIASTVLEALNHAHAARILHRDIKPENIIVTADGAPKLLDFGLARALGGTAPKTDTTVANLTGGRILGTVGYMSPEQLRGEELDAASDLFALGTVLYEMASGRPAFPGVHATERIAAILSREPPPLQGHAFPPALWPIVQRALAKDRHMRYSSASAMLSDLRAMEEGGAGPSSSPLPQSLAVLDFRNLSRQPDDDWIGSGIAESVSADLARVPGLTVVGREKMLATARATTGSAGEEQAKDALALGSILGCRWILLGSYQRLGPALRLTTQLTEVATGEVVASEKLDGPVDSLFNMQDRLSQAVLQSLNLTLPTPAGVAALTRDLQAFEYYARGRRLWQRLEKGTFDQARELYEKAIGQEPQYAPALSGLAALHAMRFTFTTDDAELEQAADYARRAIAADPMLSDPHVWLGYALMRQNRMTKRWRKSSGASTSIQMPAIPRTSPVVSSSSAAGLPKRCRSFSVRSRWNRCMGSHGSPLPGRTCRSEVSTKRGGAWNVRSCWRPFRARFRPRERAACSGIACVWTASSKKRARRASRGSKRQSDPTTCIGTLSAPCRSAASPAPHWTRKTQRRPMRP